MTHGDSISRQLGADNYLYELQGLIASNRSEKAHVWQRGTDGISWAYDWPEDPGTETMTSEAAAVIDARRIGTKPNWLVAFAGTNGLAVGGHSAATEAADFVTYLNARLAAGWSASRIVVPTMLPRTGVDEGLRSAYNTALVNAATSAGCQVARLDLDPDIGAAGQDLDTDWFADGIHPTAAGHTRIAEIVYDAMFP